MDPGTAIGLAGTVYQVIIAGIEFVGDAKQVYEKGGTDDNRNLDAVAQDIQSASASLERQLDQTKTKSKSTDGNDEIPPSEEDEELRQLAIRASSIGKELSEALGKAQIGEKSKFKAFKAVVRGNWNADDIKKIEARLNSMRSELQLRILVSIKNGLDSSQNERFDPMLQMLESLVNHNAQSGEDRRRMMESLYRNEEMARTTQKEILLSRQQILTELKSTKPSFLNTQPGSAGAEATIEQVEDAILASLWYPDRHDREDSIDEAHKKTFEWLFRDPAESGVSWNSFVEFLQMDTGKAYWITGKPGSGKSTAMKFLQGDPRTTQYLQQWSSGKRIMQAPFYFFYNGSNMQKSELGLLSSLLHTLLEQNRKLIPVAFKDRWEAALGGGQIASQKPSVFEARRALKDVIRRSPDIFFFLSVDGLDEFDPQVSATDVMSLLQLTRSLSNFSNVKLVLSSRPLSAFEQGFADCPSLAIHTLTQGDIQSYVSDKLQSHPRMNILMARDEDQTKRLIQSIADNSSGVFLWVRLVVQSLLEGLGNSDGLEELEARLEELPQDLHALYSAILSRIQPKYAPQTAKLIQLVKIATDYPDAPEFSILRLWYADQGTDSDLFDTETHAISENEIAIRTEEMKVRLQSRCLGLIDVQPSLTTMEDLCHWSTPSSTDIYDPTTPNLMLHVKFVHRTVSEFLADRDIYTRFVELPVASTFNPHAALVRSVVNVIKTFRPGHPTDWVVLLKLAAFAAGRMYEMRDQVEPGYLLKVLEELDSVMSTHLAHQRCAPWGSTGLWGSSLESEPHGVHWSSWYDRVSSNKYNTLDPKPSTLVSNMPLDGRCASLITFIVNSHLLEVLSLLVNTRGRTVLDKPGLSLLGYAICHSWPWPFKAHASLPIVKLLLEYGSRFQEQFAGETVWNWFLRTLEVRLCFQLGYEEYHMPGWVTSGNVPEVMLILLSAGADINGRMAWRTANKTDLDIQTKETLCTILLATRRAHKQLSKYSSLDVLFLKLRDEVAPVVAFLEERGAAEQEWDEEGNQIYPVPTTTQDREESSQAPPEKASSEPAYHLPTPPPPPSTKAIVETTAKSEPNVDGGTSVTKGDNETAIDPAFHEGGEVKSSSETAMALTQKKGTKSGIRGRFGGFFKSLAGKSRAG